MRVEWAAAAALLAVLSAFAPSVGQAAGPSANLAVQVVPVPSGSSAPAVAQAAGFTTLAANYEFSSPAYADPTNWLDCDDSDNSKVWHLGSPGVPSSVTEGGCAIHQKFDSVAGRMVLNVHLDVNAGCSQNPGPWCSTSLETRNENGHVISTSFPNKYYETVARVEGSFSDRTYNSPQGIWEWWQENTPGDGGIECDVVEFQYDRGGYANDGCPNWGGGGPQNGASYTGWTSYGTNNLPPGWSPTAYHKYGMLTTSDGATAVTVCWFVDDRPQSCADVPNIQANEFSQRKFLIMTAYAKGPPVPIIASRDLDVEYIHVWSCTDWAAQMCNGATKSTDGNGVTYWHP